jgi:hypothetical protein
MRFGATAIILSLVLGCPQTANGQASGPTLSVCLWAYSQDARNARYKVVVNWNGLAADRFGRLDIGAEDAGGDIWPQLRDNRLRPRAAPTEQMIVVSDASRYPLQFYLLGFDRAAMGRFDAACEDGLCSIRFPADGIVELNGDQGASIASVAQARPCPRT